MTKDFTEDARNLSASESLIMKAIWDAGGVISQAELIEVLRTRYGKDYARTTVATFILKLSDKGFAKGYREGKYAYVRALKTEEEYKAKILNESADFWFQGRIASVMSALCSTRKISDEDAEELRKILNDSVNADNNH